MSIESSTEDVAMTLVERALLQPEAERKQFLRAACGADTTLFDQALDYLEWEHRMGGFLDAPLVGEPPEKPPFEPGQMLMNRFRVIREIGHGGMGTVWEAFDTKLDRRVALKCGRRGHGKHLSPEVRNAREISHPNVCKIYEIHTTATSDGEADFISMEFLEGETLSNRLRSGPLPKDEALLVARQICSGLQEAHRNRVIHGDLKTNNIFITRDFDASIRAVITDFGLARSLDGPASPLGGTPAYMAPELWRGVAASVSSDIYALGILFWEMRSGKPPGDLGTHSTTISDGTERTGWKPPTGRDRWSRVIARCLHLDPACRFHDAAEVASALGLPKKLLWSAVAAVAAVLVAFLWNRITAPAEHVDLTMVTDGPVPSAQSSATDAYRETEAELARLSGTKKIGYRWIHQSGAPVALDQARSVLGATHVLTMSIAPKSPGYSVRGTLTDLRSGMEIGKWGAEYRADQIRYAPVALTGFVTETLHLVPRDTRAMNDKTQALVDAGYLSIGDENNLTKAFNQFEDAIRAEPDSPLPFSGLAEAQFVQYRIKNEKTWLEKSAESLRQAQMRNPDAVPVHLVAGLVTLEDERYDEAIAEYQRVLELDPFNATAYRRLGLVYRELHRKDAELAALKKAVESAPNDFHNHLELGRYYTAQSDHVKAISQLELARKLAPERTEVLYPLGVEYKDAGRFDDAEEVFRADSREKNESTILGAMGVLRMTQNRNSEAVDYLTRAIQAKDSSYSRWINLGTAELLLGDSAGSNRAYRHALELADKQLAGSPQNPLLHARVGYLCARLNQQDRSAAEIGQALKLDSNQHDSNVAWMVALTYEALNKRDETIVLLKNVPRGLLETLKRWPEVAGLSKDSRFTQLLAVQDK